MGEEHRRRTASHAQLTDCNGKNVAHGLSARRGGSKNDQLNDMNDNKIIDEAVALMNEGYSVTLPVSGRSMLPFIIGGKESVILAPPAGLKRGIVALAWVENRRYVLHRIERIEGESVTLMGDGNLVGREHCSIGDVKAIATHVVDRNQKRHYLYTRWRKTASEIWWALLPLRRYILKLNI